MMIRFERQGENGEFVYINPNRVASVRGVPGKGWSHVSMGGDGVTVKGEVGDVGAVIADSRNDFLIDFALWVKEGKTLDSQAGAAPGEGEGNVSEEAPTQ